MDIGLRLKQFRILLGLNQEDFVKGIMSESYYSRVERGKGSLETMQLMAILNKNKISLRDFFEEDEGTDYFKELAQIKMVSKGELTADYLKSLDQLFPFLDRVEKEKLMEVIFRVPFNKYETNKELVNKCSQIMMRYLVDCWENDYYASAKRAVQYLKAFKISSHSHYKILLIEYFDAWSQKDEDKKKELIEKMKRVYKKNLLEKDKEEKK